MQEKLKKSVSVVETRAISLKSTKLSHPHFLAPLKLQKILWRLQKVAPNLSLNTSESIDKSVWAYFLDMWGKNAQMSGEMLIAKAKALVTRLRNSSKGWYQKLVEKSWVWVFRGQFCLKWSCLGLSGSKLYNWGTKDHWIWQNRESNFWYHVDIKGSE